MARLLNFAEDLNRPGIGTGLAFIAGFYFSFRLIFTFLCVRALGATPQTGSAGRIALGFLLVVATWIWLLGSSNTSRIRLTHIPSVRWICAFLALTLCSLLWTEAASPAASFVYWCGTASDVLLVALFLRAGNPVQYAHALMRGFISGACVIALIAWIVPAQYDLRLGDDTFFNSNSIGNLAALAIFFTQYLARRSQRHRSALPAIFLALTLLRSLSKTTIIAFVVAEGYILLRDGSMTRRKKLLVLFSVPVALIGFWGLLAAYFDFYTSYGNASVTLTGRTAIWAYIAAHILEKPWLGHGFDSMWNVVPTFGTFEARHAENELLEQFYSYGIAGVIVAAGLYRSLYRSARTFWSSPERVVLIAMLLYVAVRGIAEAEPFDLLLPLWVAMLVATLAPQQLPAQLPTRARDIPVPAV